MKPFLKYVGGKTKLLPTIMPLIPEFDGRYHEPFVGGGAVVGALAELYHPRDLAARLSDNNAELIDVYQVVQNSPKALIANLQKIKHSKTTYYKIRASNPLTMRERATRFCYLNKTCFNGIWRVNKLGKFNVPIGSYKNPVIVDPENVMAWYELLKYSTVLRQSFLISINEAERGEFIYADPPYLPQTETADFTSYTPERFTFRDHELLADSLHRADRRKVKWLLSQGDHWEIRKLYKGYRITHVETAVSVGASSKTRIPSRELLIRNY